MEDILLHVATAASYERGGDSYWTDGYEQEGFIHACSREQLAGVLGRYFEGKSNLFLLEIDVKRLEVPVRLELSAAGEMFPHIYGKVNWEAIVKATRIRG